MVEFISTNKVYTFSSIRGHIIPKSLKCSNSATKFKDSSEAPIVAKDSFGVPALDLRGLKVDDTNPAVPIIRKCPNSHPKGPSSPYVWFLVPMKAPKSLK